MNSLPKLSALQLNHERLPCTFSRRRSIPGPADHSLSLIYLARLATDGRRPSDPDFIRPELSPTGSKRADLAGYLGSEGVIVIRNYFFSRF